MTQDQQALGLRAYYWKEDFFLQNLGDTLMPAILAALGYRAVSRQTTHRQVANPGRCLMGIGSLLTTANLDVMDGPFDVWGTGWKGSPTAPRPEHDLRYFAVRGPKTAQGLGLPADIPQGDPALLLPHLFKLENKPATATVLVPHISHFGTHTARARCATTGADEVVLPRVLHPQWVRQLLKIRAWEIVHWLRTPLKLGFTIYPMWEAVRRIAGADFVLTGSLHGAILAQSYGVPWAAFDDHGFVDAPAKWDDWASYLGIELDFVTTVAEGNRWWASTGRHGRLRPLGPLLRAFPYPLRTPHAQHLAQTLP